ncbi:MAG: VCBS repeat-containing protein, partial [Polyangiaceae bacterium]|nr:VCBS repeat-containing protein [Polyangiaceae bacterium]
MSAPPRATLTPEAVVLDKSMMQGAKTGRPGGCRGRAAPALAAGLAAVALSAPAVADWPVARHDARRTGASTRKSDIDKPAAYWRAYLGGALGGAELHVGDTDQDGNVDVLYISGGRLILARPDGEVVWKTASVGFSGIAAVSDLDLDGASEVVALGPASASLVAGATGEIVWRQSPDELGTLTTARLADLNGDGVPDLFLDRCGCCAIETSSPGVIYSFPAGPGAPVVLPAPPPRPHCGSAADTVGDWDGDGIDDLLLA